AGFREGMNMPKLQIWIEKFDGAEALGAHLVRSLRENLGVEAGYSVEPTSQFKDARVKNRMQLFVRHWGADFPDPENFFNLFLSSNSANPAAWKNTYYDTAVERSRTAADDTARLGAFRDAERLLLLEEVV